VKTLLLFLFAVAAAVVIYILTGCASVQRGSVALTLPPKPANCPIKILTLVPQEKFEEVAMLAMSGGTTSIKFFEAKLRAEACALGGDAVIVPKVKFDEEREATVIRWSR
jgi:hypothetical protein